MTFEQNFKFSNTAGLQVLTKYSWHKMMDFAGTENIIFFLKKRHGPFWSGENTTE
jgi:hypothetical protein